MENRQVAQAENPEVTKEPIVFRPTREQVEGLRVGDKALDCFGNWRTIVEIRYRGEDVNGHAFVGYAVPFGEHATISDSMKEGRIQRTVPLCQKYTSHEIDRMETI